MLYPSEDQWARRSVLVVHIWRAALGSSRGSRSHVPSPYHQTGKRRKRCKRNSQPKHRLVKSKPTRKKHAKLITHRSTLEPLATWLRIHNGMVLEPTSFFSSISCHNASAFRCTRRKSVRYSQSDTREDEERVARMKYYQQQGIRCGFQGEAQLVLGRFDVWAFQQLCAE
jgi:hypothetical protein